MRAVLLALVALAGDVAVAKTYRLTVSAEVSAEAAGRNSGEADGARRFWLISRMAEDAVDAELADELTDQIRRGLGLADLLPAAAAEDADVAISFVYGFGTPTVEIPWSLLSRLAESNSLPVQSTFVDVDFPFYLQLVAYDLKAYLEKDEAIALWRSQVTGSTKEPDLSKQVAVMLAGAIETLGKHIEGTRQVRVSDLSGTALYIRGVRESP